MCGIAGVYEYAWGSGTLTAELIDAMRDTLVHRGPDGEGTWISDDRRVGLGHRRLSIVDPAGGAQPMFGPGGECLVFNGEIYNYPALRRELEADGVRFATDCDTEVILHLHARLGEGFVDRLTGQFAVALWDPAAEALLLARDPIGEKPLYWAVRGPSATAASSSPPRSRRCSPIPRSPPRSTPPRSPPTSPTSSPSPPTRSSTGSTSSPREPSRAAPPPASSSAAFAPSPSREPGRTIPPGRRPPPFAACSRSPSTPA